MTPQPALNVNLAGRHCILELYECPGVLLNDQDFVRETLKQAAEVAQSALLGELSHQFEPQGVTALVMLAESHISIHTWPETGYAAVDVFTCGESTQPEAACRFIAKTLEAGRYELSTLFRDGPEVRPQALVSQAL
ncbi:MAG: adenosylmethionine decarboxylase [Cyanobacteria bacterium P01_F01_bin.42]